MASTSTASAGFTTRRASTSKAVEELERAVNITDNDPTITEHLGDAYRKMGKLKEASQPIRRRAQERRRAIRSTRLKDKIQDLRNARAAARPPLGTEDGIRCGCARAAARVAAALALALRDAELSAARSSAALPRGGTPVASPSPPRCLRASRSRASLRLAPDQRRDGIQQRRSHHVKAREDIIVRRPASLRVEAMSPFGVALIVAAQDSPARRFSSPRRTL